MIERTESAFWIVMGIVGGVIFTSLLLLLGGVLTVTDRWGRFPFYAACVLTGAIVVSFIQTFRYIPNGILGYTLQIDAAMMLLLPLVCLTFALWRECWRVE